MKDEKLKKALGMVLTRICGELAVGHKVFSKDWEHEIEQAVLNSPEWFAEHGYVKAQPVPASLEQGIRGVLCVLCRDLLAGVREGYGDKRTVRKCTTPCDELPQYAAKILSLLHATISPQEGELVDINKILNQVWQGSKSKGIHEIPDGAEEALIVAQYLANKARMAPVAEPQTDFHPITSAPSWAIEYLKAQGLVKLPSEDELERMVEDSIEDRFQLDSTINSQINYAKLLCLLKESK